MARIELDRVNLTFRVRRFDRLNLKDFVIQELARCFLGKQAAPAVVDDEEDSSVKPGSPVKEVPALRDVSLRVDQGDRLGILGHNGAGKSTLLKVLAGIYPPTEGKLVVEGRVSSLFDISLGFEHDANGWDNIMYRSYLQGETPAQVRDKRQQVAEFSELGKFLNMPIRYYSAGMLVRLAFSIATAIEPEILLVDEVLSVGDLAFQQKARARMKEMMNKAHLMVVVSHDLGALEKMCNRLI